MTVQYYFIWCQKSMTEQPDDGLGENPVSWCLAISWLCLSSTSFTPKATPAPHPKAACLGEIGASVSAALFVVSRQHFLFFWKGNDIQNVQYTLAAMDFNFHMKGNYVQHFWCCRCSLSRKLKSLCMPFCKQTPYGSHIPADSEAIHLLVHCTPKRWQLRQYIY